MKISPYKLLLALAYLLSLGFIAHLAWRGLPYYLTPLVERPRHEAYWALKPGGSLGHLFGIVGSSLMVLMQLYTVRKRFPGLRRVGRLRLWLDFHIYCGIIGPLLIVLHSSFKVQGLVALSFWSMIVVALSGFLGRYLYLQVPRRRSGTELSLNEVEEMTGRLTQRLRQETGLDEQSLALLDRLVLGGLRVEISLPVMLLRLPFEGISLRWKLRAYRRSLRRELPRKELRQLGRMAYQRAILQRRVLQLAKLQELFHYWHVLHKPFAVIMYIFMFVHIGVVLATGYAWGAG
jgi:hypothetical protein